MILRLKLLIIVALAQLFSLHVSVTAQQTRLSISTPEEIKAEFNAVPCKNDERLSAVKTLFEKMGASPSDVSIEKFKEVENLVVRKQGSSAEKIVVGAHYDKVAEGCGAIDNWTGIVALAHLYRTLKNVPSTKTLVFVAFGKEEKGLIGSHAMTSAIAKSQVAQYCAAINIDSLGLTAPQVGDNMSSKKLEMLAADIAKEMKMPFAHASIYGADADSSSFIEKRIPALTIHGLSNNWPSILHSHNDQASKVNPASVYLGYRLALALIARVDSSACDAYK